MTLRKRLRALRHLTSTKALIGASILLVCSAGMCYGGYASWGLFWVGNIAATLIIASITAVILDRLIVRQRRARLTAVLRSGRDDVQKWANCLIKRVNEIREDVLRKRPQPSFWTGPSGYTSAGIEDTWRFERERLDEAVNAWTVVTGFGLRSIHVNAVNEGLADLRDAYTEALDSYQDLADHMKRKSSPFSMLLGEPPPEPDENVVKAVDVVDSKVKQVAHQP